MSDEEILEMLANDIKLRGLSQNTLEEYINRIRIFMSYFESPVEQLDEADVKEFLLYLLNDRKLKHGTVHTYNSALRFLYGVTLNKPLNVWQIPVLLESTPEPLRVCFRGRLAKHGEYFISQRPVCLLQAPLQVAGLRVMISGSLHSQGCNIQSSHSKYGQRCCDVLL